MKAGTAILIFLSLLLIAENEGRIPPIFKRTETGNVHFYCLNDRYIYRFMKVLDKKLDNVLEKLDASLSGKSDNFFKEPRDCAEVLKSGSGSSGVYTINPDGRGAFKVYCDQETNGGGWTVFQKRQDGSVNFYRCWADYENGFGDLNGEFWLGLDKINRLTHQTRNLLRVDLQDHERKSAYAEYDYFAVADERNKYTLSLGNYTGTAGDSLAYHRGMPFSTKDRDNDNNDGTHYNKNCAEKNVGAWWFNNCQYSNLNGFYYRKASVPFAKGINWFRWKGDHYSLKKAQMKFRPVYVHV